MTAPLSSIDLTRAEQSALGIAAAEKLYRRKGAWRAAGGKGVVLRVADSLLNKNLLRVDNSGPAPRLVPTGQGFMLRAVIDARRQARRSA